MPLDTGAQLLPLFRSIWLILITVTDVSDFQLLRTPHELFVWMKTGNVTEFVESDPIHGPLCPSLSFHYKCNFNTSCLHYATSENKLHLISSLFDIIDGPFG